MTWDLQEIKKTLADHEKRIQKIEKAPLEDHAEIALREDDVPGIKKLAKKTGVAEGKLNELYDLEGEQLTVLKICGKADRDKTQNIASLVLLGYKYLFSKEEVLAQEIKRNVAENRIPLNNFGTYVKEMAPQKIRRKGKLKSPKTIYRLTTLGEAEARDLIKKVGA